MQHDPAQYGLKNYKISIDEHNIDIDWLTVSSSGFQGKDDSAPHPETLHPSQPTSQISHV